MTYRAEWGLQAPTDLFRQVGAGWAFKMQMINCPADGIVWCEWGVWISCVGQTAPNTQKTKTLSDDSLLLTYTKYQLLFNTQNHGRRTSRGLETISVVSLWA